ncbi:hypothetical protein GLOTRDRAFT_82505 [Gloeophyllum trabeum ATCC 11539]|uniref:Uncharacterized protein n=1 Tax=Gloeophyllum trabeum (strain ATCC 11539 / FP-39264 / Madison 617) TaxID=670483 RepID=S7PR29_GLOTA|nr:uncharacterized protein GLOTRDRAFT_82505 [Gloeophyllum trabeum ATCC 11539]EPQ50296.1 hypothetical protein GLOTRDRAFT_82505 [Gloeophyllum trabeum ATCC 11539]
MTSIDASTNGSTSRAAVPDISDPQAWTERLSTSFSAMANEIAAASQALAASQQQRKYDDAPSSTTSLEVDVAALGARLEAIEAKQETLSQELEGLKEIIGQKPEEGSPEARMEALEKKLNELADTVKLDQQRLYARLCNASIRHQTATVKAPPTANGKPAPNFPGTKGEFEHLTKERYEGLMKAFGIPIKGDTDAKREAVREFLGLPGWLGAKANN